MGCWVHWTVDVPVEDLRECFEFAVRCWDDSQNCQPERPTWNLMGMMNNPWFRVKVHDVPGENAIWFEHPTRVEPNLKQAWDKDRLHLDADGKLPSPGWQERLQKHYSAAFAPLPLQEQPLDGEGYNGKARFLRTETTPLAPAMEISKEAMSGDGTHANVGIKVNNQMFDTQEALDKHLNEADSAAVASTKPAEPAVKKEKKKKEKKSSGGGGGLTMAEVAKHTTKTDCWVVLSGNVPNVTNFLTQHPGGELAILTFAGKDATAEFDMIHPPDVVGKYAPDAVIGTLGAGKAPKQKKAKRGIAAPAGPQKDKGSAIGNHHAWGHHEDKNWRHEAHELPGVFIINVKAYFYAAWYMVLAFMYEICATIFTSKNIQINGDRKGLTRSAIFLIVFMVIHAVGNLHVFKGPDDFNGYGYFYVRLYWTGFGLPANIVEEYIALSVLLHAFVGLKRTWDMKLALVKTQGFNALNLAISGLMLLTFMTIHLFQFRFGDTDQFGPYFVRPPPYLINFWGILSLNLFWAYEGDVKVG